MRYSLRTAGLPNKENECVVDVDYMEKKQTEDRRYDHVFKRYGCRGYRFFETDTFRITGTVSSPEYICFQRGSTTIGNGSVRAFVYVQEESFAMDVYTEICIQAAGAKRIDGIYFGI